MASEAIKGSTVEVYGSFATELCLPHSDIDLVVKCPNSAFYIPDLLRNLEKLLSVYFCHIYILINYRNVIL